jgi:periplasmic glucans biosynthesis protein
MRNRMAGFFRADSCTRVSVSLGLVLGISLSFLAYGQNTSVTAAPAGQSRASTTTPVQDSPIQALATPQTQAPLSAANLFDAVTRKAQERARTPYERIQANTTPALSGMNYDQYRLIHFRPESALWKGESMFEIQMFHPGFLYREPIILHTNPDNLREEQAFKQEFFSYEGEAAAVAGEVPPNAGFAGFRVHYPLNSNNYKDEFLVFQGASYFRIIGPGLNYGLSARGLAIDTAEPNGEEFPIFREFWLIKPGPNDNHLVIYALLDSQSVTGAYRFDVHPGAPTEMHVEARIFARKDIRKLGIAPLTSMYMWGENHVRPIDDYRPEVHDSDGLLVALANGEWVWRPLSNHRTLHVSSMTDVNPRGFGLMQRDRNFDHYLDMDSRYETRPSMWIIPESGWGAGRIELVEIPSDSETNDNIVSYWVPANPLKAGASMSFKYKLRSIDNYVPENSNGKVVGTRIGWGANPGQQNPPPHSLRKFVIDFRGGELDNISPDAPVEAIMKSSSGTMTELQVVRLPDGKTWRVSFKLQPDGNNLSDMRMHLQLRDQRLTEVWSYVWYPDAIQ